MSYRNWESTRSTMKSYTRAMKQILELCPAVEPSSNEFNGRTVLPTRWRPSFGFNLSELLGKCNRLFANTENLFDFGRPVQAQPRWNIWERDFFKVSCGIDVEFDIYQWDEARRHCLEEDEAGNCIRYEDFPAEMVKFCSPQYIYLEVYDGVWRKCWGLKDWNKKQGEIRHFFDSANENIKGKYLEAVDKANSEVEKWQKAIADMASIKIPQG